MADTKTQALARPFADWAASDVPEPRRAETLALDALFREATGFVPQVWTGGIVGYGAYDYTYASGRTGTWMATGFAPRKARISVYIMPGYTDFSPILERLGRIPRAKAVFTSRGWPALTPKCWRNWCALASLTCARHGPCARRREA